MRHAISDYFRDVSRSEMERNELESNQNIAQTSRDQFESRGHDFEDVLVIAGIDPLAGHAHRHRADENVESRLDPNTLESRIRLGKELEQQKEADRVFGQRDGQIVHEERNEYREDHFQSRDDVEQMFAVEVEGRKTLVIDAVVNESTGHDELQHCPSGIDDDVECHVVFDVDQQIADIADLIQNTGEDEENGENSRRLDWSTVAKITEDNENGGEQTLVTVLERKMGDVVPGVENVSTFGKDGKNDHTPEEEVVLALTRSEECESEVERHFHLRSRDCDG